MATFTPSTPIITASWNNNTNSNTTSWTNDAIPDVFDTLADIDGNLIVDTAGNYISLLGGYTGESASSSTTVPANTGNTNVTWTAEG